MAKQLLHSTAIIDQKAKIGINVAIGPYTIIGSEVTVGDNTVIENHVTVKGQTTIGKDNSIGAYTSIGLSAQDKAHRNEPTKVIIGDGNEIREYVSIHRGTLGGTGVTKLGNNNQIMINSHFAHDTDVGNHCMIANSTTLGGHVKMGSYVVTGGASGFHQFCRIGDYAMLGGYSAAYQDIAPYTLCVGHRAQLKGLNIIGLKKNGFSKEEINEISRIFTIFFDKGLVPKQAIALLKKEIPSNPICDRFIDFVISTSRGIISKS